MPDIRIRVPEAVAKHVRRSPGKSYRIRVPTGGLKMATSVVIPVPLAKRSVSGRTEAQLWPNGTVAASSASLTDVQTAYDAVSDGGIITIPNGSATWTSGLDTSTNKNVLIRALNYTETTKPTSSTTRNVTITNNSTSEPLFSFTTGNTYHSGFAGIHFDEGAALDQNHMRFTGTGNKPPLISDMRIDSGLRSGSASIVSAVWFNTLGGVVWNTYWHGEDGGFQPASCYVQSQRSWETADTLGDNDTDGLVNVYFEDSTSYRMSQFPDVDKAGRFVMRYMDQDGSWLSVHAFSTAFPPGGGRHIEVYETSWAVTDQDRSVANRYIWLRQGTCVAFNNVVNNASFPSEYGDIDFLQMGDDTAASGTYLIDRQVGCGHNGTSYESDPVYVWDCTGARAYTTSVRTGWTSEIQDGRDFFSAGSNPGAKSGYTSFTYPHPLRYTPG